MNHSFSHRRRGAVTLALLLLVGSAAAVRVDNTSPPSASAVQSSHQQPSHQQLDESASLRSGTITAVAGDGSRIQVQGTWLEIAVGKTKLIRGGRPATLDSLKVGEAIRFTVAPATAGTPSVRVIYAP